MQRNGICAYLNHLTPPIRKTLLAVHYDFAKPWAGIFCAASFPEAGLHLLLLLLNARKKPTSEI